MRIESILGIIASLIAIGTIISQGYKKFQTKDLATLFTELADPNTPIKKQHRILHKISQDARLNGNSISKSYIRNFSSDRRSKSAIFHEICLKNGIEPTKDLCSKVLGYDEPSFYKEWVQYHKQDTVYMSALLKERYKVTYERLIAILDKYGIPHALLEGTRDIWCRDYMPVQTSGGKLVQFRYDPSYLKRKPEWRASRSDVKEVCAANRLHPIFSDINLDGGNVVMYGKKAIITDRVFSENPKIDRDELRKQLSELLDAEIVIIPAYAKSIDFTGHADGMMRFVDAETVIG
ncbi:MAG: agmatine deiminase family protein, partial [Bacteroidales bacterium]|nr:agmatine deiminase family protein [Bacteroidales bacterium]